MIGSTTPGVRVLLSQTQPNEKVVVQAPASFPIDGLKTVRGRACRPQQAL